MLIGIAGYARHGKDTIADIIVARYGYHKRALADVMKEACRVIFGWTDAHLYGELKDVVDPRYGVSPRHALQSIGTQWGQFELAKYDDFAAVTGRKLWVNSLLSRIQGDTVISDVRFPHEAEAIRARGGGIIIMVTRPHAVDLSHESELSVKQIAPDFTIRNYGTIADLEWQTCKLMDGIILTRNV